MSEDGYDVFISSAAEDKETLAVPIYYELLRRGIRAFVDLSKRQAGSTEQRIKGIKVGVFILSPEFACNEGLMRELLCFTRMIEIADAAGAPPQNVPILIPIFYRLTAGECRDSLVFQNHRLQSHALEFFKRVESGEANKEKVLDVLSSVAMRKGIENDAGLTNDSSQTMTEARRHFVADTICPQVEDAIGEGRKSNLTIPNATARLAHTSEAFNPAFYTPLIPAEIMFDFTRKDAEGNPGTSEGKVLQEVLRERNSSQTARIVSIHGMAGVGKSCLMRAIARIEKVRRRYSGGVYYMCLGMDANKDKVVSELLKVVRQSGGKAVAEALRDETSFDVILEAVSAWLDGRKCLLLLDDVWERNGLGTSLITQLTQLFGVGSSSAIVLSTRFATVAETGIVVTMKPKDPFSEEAQAMLLKYAKFTREDIRDARVSSAIKEMLKRCAGLPLFLAAIGRGIAALALNFAPNRVLAWERFLAMVTRTASICFHMTAGLHKDLLTIFSASIMVLEERQKAKLGFELKLSVFEMHRALSVLPKQTIASLPLLRRIWRLATEEQAILVLNAFVEVGLADVERGRGGRVEGLRLHDLVHEFSLLCAQSKDEYKLWHERILTAYLKWGNEIGECRPWWILKDDGYILLNLARHLVESGSTKELIGLLLDASWTVARLDKGGLRTWNMDFEQCLNSIDGERKDMSVLRSGLCFIRDVVIESWGIVVGNKKELAFQIHARLLDLDRKFWPVERYLESVRIWQPKPWLRPRWRCFQRPGHGRMIANIPLKHRIQDVAMNASLTFAVVAAGQHLLFVRMEESKAHRVVALQGSAVLCVAMTGDCKTVVTGSSDGTVRLWDAATGNKIGRGMKGHRGPVWSVAVTLDGEHIVSGSWDGTVRLWDATDGTQIGEEMKGHERAVCAVAISADGCRIVSGSSDNTVRIWDALAGMQIGSALKGHEGPVWSVAFSAGGKQVISGSSDGTIRIWDVENGTQIGEALRGHEDAISSVSISADGGRIVSGSSDHTVRVWDATTGKQIGDAMKGHVGPVWSASVSADGGRIVSGSSDGTLRVWDVSMETRLREVIRRHERAVCSVAVSADGREVVSGSSDCTVRVWDAATGTQVGPAMRGHNAEVESVAFSAAGFFVVSGSVDNTIRVWNRMTSKLVGSPQTGHDRGVFQLEVTKENVVTSQGLGQERIDWKLDSEHGLVRIQDDDCEQRSETGDESDAPESTEADLVRLNCWRQSVMLGTGRSVLATLPASVYPRSWSYDASTRMLVTGLSNGQVLVHSLVQ